MFRRVVSLLLLPCVLLTQSAAFGHTHGGGQPAGHDLCPHIHFQTPFSDHHHDHSDGAPDHDHDDDNHDSDAVYVPSVDVVVSERCVIDDGADAASVCATVGENIFVTPSPVLPRPSAQWSHPPPSCPLYIRQLTLLM